jgi:hypothetical protein
MCCPLVLHGLGTVFDSLGRALICLGPDFRIVHGTRELDELRGRTVEEIFGPELFGPDGTLCRARAAG